MKKLSACFTGHRKSKLPYSITSNEYKKIEEIIKNEIINLIDVGVHDFYSGGQTGIDTTCAQLVIYLRDEENLPIRLHLVIPYKNMNNRFYERQKNDYTWIMKKADSIKYIHEEYTPNCYRDRNQYMVDKSDYLIAVWDGSKNSGTWMTINMARKQNLHIIIESIK